jgi:NTE family protein
MNKHWAKFKTLLNGRLLIPLLASLLATSCASDPPNAPINKIHPDTGYRFEAIDAGDNSEDLFIILTFSGGGTRAAALSYGVMEKLRSTRIQWNGQQKSLLDEVDVISSVSGGSFTAAYYGLFRERLFANKNGFEERFLYRNIEGKLKLMLFNPYNWVRLLSPTFGRIDMAAEFYDEAIFEKRTYKNLQEKGRPFIMLNATDMSKGSPFSFVQPQFDLICSDLSQFSVARAVAASSDFPIAFTPLQIKNYADKCPYKKPKWMELAALDRDFSINPRRNNRARKQWSYRDAGKRPYIHLLDGGVSDNIGLRGPLTALTSNNYPWSIPNKINNKKIKKLVVIVVDAKTLPNKDYDTKQSPPGLIKVLETVSTVPLDNYSFDTIELLKNKFKRWQKDRKNLWSNPKHAFQHCPPKPDKMTSASLQPLDLYAIYIGFDQIADGETYQGENRSWYLSLPTAFNLPAGTIDKLRGVGKDLLEASEPFKALVGCMNSAP